jgi:hypothetical protein
VSRKLDAESSRRLRVGEERAILIRVVDFDFCGACRTFLGPGIVRCTACGKQSRRQRLKRVGAGLVTLVTGTTMSVTLSACYGTGCAGADCEEDDQGPPKCGDISATPTTDDADGDGYCLMYDCNENDTTINAAADDASGDGVDQNCDGVDGVKN